MTETCETNSIFIQMVALELFEVYVMILLRNGTLLEFKFQ